MIAPDIVVAILIFLNIPATIIFGSNRLSQCLGWTLALIWFVIKKIS